jgi:hypothetical protein
VAVAKFANLILTGKSGERYCFQTWPYQTCFRPVGAVFFITRRVLTNATFRRAHHEVIHVGQTSNMSDPLGTPADIAAFEKHGANCVCVYPATDEAYRIGMVKDLVASHRPALAI